MRGFPRVVPGTMQGCPANQDSATLPSTWTTADEDGLQMSGRSPTDGSGSGRACRKPLSSREMSSSAGLKTSQISRLRSSTPTTYRRRLLCTRSNGNSQRSCSQSRKRGSSSSIAGVETACCPRSASSTWTWSSSTTRS